jgi:hypothetical protein
MQNGMPRYSMMSKTQVMQLWSYVRSRARETLAEQQKAQPTPVAQR